MLLRFQVANHRSILEPVELSMIAVDEDRPAAREFEGLSERVLTVAGIYGPNASGKSNVLDALAWLSMAVANSLRLWDDRIPRDAHRFGDGPTSPSEFELDIVVDGIRHGYRLEVHDSAVRYESLDSYPERRRRNLFTRHGDQIDFRRGFDGARRVQELLMPATLALSAAMRVNGSITQRVGRTIARVGVLGQGQRGFYRPDLLDSTAELFLGQGDTNQPSLFSPSEERPLGIDSNLALELLRFADPGIHNYKVVERERRHRRWLTDRLRLVHQVGDEPVAFELEEESAGTQTWFHLIGPALRALQNGRILLLDEIDASLHPRLSTRLIEIFQDPLTNPHGAQLVFTSHDTSLLNSLNRDEVWLTEKARNGATHLVALAEFAGERVRKSLNLERAYLQGRFGSIPDVDQAEVRRALGLFSESHDG